MVAKRTDSTPARKSDARFREVFPPKKKVAPTPYQATRKQVPGAPKTVTRVTPTPHQATRKTASTFKPNVKLDASQIRDRRSGVTEAVTKKFVLPSQQVLAKNAGAKKRQYRS